MGYAYNCSFSIKELRNIQEQPMKMHTGQSLGAHKCNFLVLSWKEISLSMESRCVTLLSLQRVHRPGSCIQLQGSKFLLGFHHLGMTDLIISYIIELSLQQSYTPLPPVPGGAGSKLQTCNHVFDLPTDQRPS